MKGRDCVFQGSDVRGVLGSTYTKRRIDVEGRYPEARRWIDTHDAKPQPDLEREVLASLAPAQQDVLSMALYRGRFLADEYTSPVDDDFGPPPAANAGAGRYNAHGVAVLYLCSTIEGVRRELGAPPARKALWVQTYLALSALRIADARGFPDTSLTGAILYLIESIRPDAALGHNHPTLGHRLGEIVGAHFDGILVPGVRGDENVQYCNVVVFRPHENDRWRNLIDRRAARVVADVGPQD